MKKNHYYFVDPLTAPHLSSKISQHPQDVLPPDLKFLDGVAALVISLIFALL